MSEDDNDYIEIYIPTDEEYWEAFPNAQGVDKADILLQLSMSCGPDILGEPAIIMAELAIEVYRELGYTEEGAADFAFARNSIERIFCSLLLTLADIPSLLSLGQSSHTSVRDSTVETHSCLAHVT